MNAKRKGAKSLKDLTQEIKDQLNAGTLESANLTEWLAVDAQLLLRNFLIENKKDHYLSKILMEVDSLKKKTVNTINEAIGLGLMKAIKENNDVQLNELLMTHPSDTVRCWATYTIGRDDDLDITSKLNLLQRFAADSHFGVREIAWMSVRPHLSKEIEQALNILIEWTKSDNVYIRRFATESTRPRGVWCEHIELLKAQPRLALSILNPLRSDPSKYVRDSVSNWLNDISKSQPQFVKELCLTWEKESPTKETIYIIKRALRTINK